MGKRRTTATPANMAAAQAQDEPTTRVRPQRQADRTNKTRIFTLTPEEHAHLDAVMAETGQTGTHAPQSIHSTGSM